MNRGWTADICEIYCAALLRGILQMPNIFHERRWKLRRKDGWACVRARACVKQIRNTQRIRSLPAAEHGGASGGEGVLPGCSSLAGPGRHGNAENKGFISSAHLSLSPSHHRDPPGGRELHKRYEVSCLDGSKFRILKEEQQR